MADDHRLTDPRGEGGSDSGPTAGHSVDQPPAGYLPAARHPIPGHPPTGPPPPGHPPSGHWPSGHWQSDHWRAADPTPAIPSPRGVAEPGTDPGSWRRLPHRWNPLSQLRCIPLTACYLALLGVTTIVLAAVGPQTAHDLLAWSSTDVSHLFSYPVWVLLASALWLPDLDWWGTALAFLCAVAPVERRVGPRWTLAVLASAHVIATLSTELPIAWAVSHGYLARHAEHRLDVGVSYLLYGAFGACLGLWPRTLRWLASTAVLAGLTVVLFRSSDPLTASGHVVAFVVGIAWWFWLARRGLLGGRFTIRFRAPRAAGGDGPGPGGPYPAQPPSGPTPVR